MKLVFTDSRFPLVTIGNDGTSRFQVLMDGEVEETFTGKERLGDDNVSEDFARRRAQAYFDRLASVDLIGEDQALGAKKVPPYVIERSIARTRAEFDPELRRKLEAETLALMSREESVAEQTVNAMLYDF